MNLSDCFGSISSDANLRPETYSSGGYEFGQNTLCILMWNHPVPYWQPSIEVRLLAYIGVIPRNTPITNTQGRERTSRR